MTDDTQRIAVAGRVWRLDDPECQQALAQGHASSERPRCLCVPDGVEMYVARYQNYVVKRLPGTGHQHATVCPSYEPEAQDSGLGELVGEAVLEDPSGGVELRVDFPWERCRRSSVPGARAAEAGEVATSPRRMSLRAIVHFLFERAGFNRWSPAMTGKRSQGVLHKYLLEAANGVTVKGTALSDRLFVPEPFSEASREDSARRRRDKFAVLTAHDDERPLLLVMGEYKGCELCDAGRKVWIKHLPDLPLLVAGKTWERVERRYAPLFEARDADGVPSVHLLLAALVRARREHTYEIDSATLMLASAQWIPVEGVHELPLIEVLVQQRRRFIKPLRYDADCAAYFANALLLDLGSVPVPLHVESSYRPPHEQRAKARAIARAGEHAWAWRTSDPMPPLPPPSGRARP